MPVARGLGLGFDLPLVTHALPGEAAEHSVEAGMVLALTAYIWKEGVAPSTARTRSCHGERARAALVDSPSVGKELLT